MPPGGRKQTAAAVCHTPVQSADAGPTVHQSLRTNAATTALIVRSPAAVPSSARDCRVVVGSPQPSSGLRPLVDASCPVFFELSAAAAATLGLPSTKPRQKAGRSRFVLPFCSRGTLHQSPCPALVFPSRRLPLRQSSCFSLADLPIAGRSRISVVRSKGFTDVHCSAETIAVGSFRGRRSASAMTEVARASSAKQAD